MIETATIEQGVGTDKGSGDSRGVDILKLYRRLQQVKPEERKNEIVLHFERRAGTSDLERILTEKEKTAIENSDDSFYVAAVFLMKPEEQKIIYQRIIPLDGKHYNLEQRRWVKYCMERAMEKIGIYDDKDSRVIDEYDRDWFGSHNSGRFRAVYGLRYPDKIRVE